MPAILHCLIWTSVVFVIFGWEAITLHGVIGFDGAEIWAFVWGHHWMHESLSDGSWPYHTQLLDHPNGGVLWLKDPIMLVLMHPIRLVLGIQKAVLFSQYLLFLIASCSTFALARHHAFGIRLSIFCGLAYAFCPHALGEAYNGNIEALSHGWLPLWFYCWLKLIQAPSLPRTLYCAISLFALLVSNQYWGIAMSFAGMATLPLLGKHSWKNRALIVSSVLLGGAMFAPVAYSIWISLHAPIRLNDVTAGSIPLQAPYLSDINEIFFPMSSENPTPFQDLIYVGFLIMLLSITSLWSKTKSWHYFFLGWGYVILMLGPFLYWNENLILSGQGTKIRLPWFYLFQNIQGLDWMTLPHRMAIPASLFLTLSAGFWVTQSKRREWVLPFILLELWLYPSYQVPLKTTELPNSEHATLLKELPAGGVLNLPINLYSNTQRKFLWYQTIHHHPIADHFRYSMYPHIAEESLFVSYSRAITQAPLPTTKNPDPLEVKKLKKNGFMYVVLHKEFIQEQLQLSPQAYAQWMNLYLGEGIILDDAYLYPLDTSTLGTIITSYPSTFTLGLPQP